MIEIVEAGPLTSVQDIGRFGMLKHGVAASGPMDQQAFDRAGTMLVSNTQTGLEVTSGRLIFTARGRNVRMACACAGFEMRVNGKRKTAPTGQILRSGDSVEISPDRSVPGANYAYIRFDREIDVPAVLGSFATNLVAGLGGFEGRALKPGDVLNFKPATSQKQRRFLEKISPEKISPVAESNRPVRFIWGVHADKFSLSLRHQFVSQKFVISRQMNRMGVRLEDPDGVFEEQMILGLVSDAIVPGDIQILGDGSPIVLMRDHQPTGGYPRIATIISADLSRFAQLIPGTLVKFTPVSVEHAHKILAGMRK